jgi:hypothetical protein
MKVHIVTANCGNFDPEVDPVPQRLPANVKLSFTRYNDANFPRRIHSMTPRLQARIPKCFAWDMPASLGSDIYLWVDNSCALLHPDSTSWFLDQLGDNSIAVFRHPDRKTVQAEYEFLKEKLQEKNKSLTCRYEGEDLEGQMRELVGEYPLYASTAFIYRNHSATQMALTEWWGHISRFHSIDQLSFPRALHHNLKKVVVIEQSYLKVPYLTYVRNLKSAGIEKATTTYQDDKLECLMQAGR